MTAVKVTHLCCGGLGIVIDERSRPGSFAHYGVYDLELIASRGGTIESVAIGEFTTHRGYHFVGEISELYGFSIAPGQGNWSVGVSHASHFDDRYTTGTVGLHYEEAELTAAELQVLYEQALAVLTKAENHAPVTEETYLHPGLPCGLPEHQACEPGGKW